MFSSRFIFVSIIALSFSFFSAHAAIQDQQHPSKEPPVPSPEKAIGKTVGDYTLVDQDGRRFTLKELRGKPVIVSFIYTSCSHICPTITSNLNNAIKEANKDLGTKFNVLTVSFDAEHDTPKTMKQFGLSFVDDFTQWRFASADRDIIKKMTKDFGFYYKKVDGAYEHMNMVTIVDAQGKIYRHVYGLDFKPEQVVEPLYGSLNMTYSAKKTGSIINRIKLFCYRYDPVTGTYIVDYAMISALILGISVQFAIIFMLVYLIRGMKGNKGTVHKKVE